MNAENLCNLQDELRTEVLELNSRCLYASAKWCAELLNDIGDDLVNNRGHPPEEPRLLHYPLVTSDILLAKVYFEVKEFLRCAHLLQDNHTPHGRFLKWYAKFLAGERLRQQQRIEAKDHAQRASIRNPYINEILNEMHPCYKNQEMDGYCLFVYALIHKRLGKTELSRNLLLESLTLSPLNWSAWLTLAELIPDKQVLAELELSQHWISEFFYAHIYTSWPDIDSLNQADELLSRLALKFQESSWVVAKTIHARYHTRKFADAQSLCEDLLKQDPYRLDDMDVYSHILYVKEARSELSRLAHLSTKIDKYRPETCSIVGNYYSLKGSHEKAILYFNRALKLDPNNLSPLTLVGHEFLEMRNANAALEAYRRVVDADPLDFRAWYGLGQTYEILEMPSYALYYFRKACEIQPYDYRMWNAMGKCYENLKNINDAIEAYKKADGNDDEQGLSAYNLGRLYAKQGKQTWAATYYKKFVRLMHANESGREKDHYHTALLFLGEFHLRNKKYAAAEKNLRPLLDSQGNQEYRQKAESMITRIENALAAMPSQDNSSDEDMQIDN